MNTQIKHNLILLLSIFIFFGCGGDSSNPSTEVGRNESLIKNFILNGDNKRVYVEIRDFNNTISDQQVNEWKNTIASFAESYWRLYDAYDFKSPYTAIESGREVLKIFLEQGTGGYSGSAGGEWLRLAGPPLTNDNQLNLESTIAHEMFHSIQFKSKLERFSNTLTEGTAVLVPELLNLALHNKISTTYSCDSIYLGNPDGNMWFRPAGSDKHDVCASSLWWRYLSQQLSTQNSSQYDYGIDTIKEMFNHLEAPQGWRLQETDKLQYANDFNGNNIDEILIQNDTHIAVLSPLLYNPSSLSIVANNGRFGGGWRYQSTDRIVGSCHLGGPNGSVFLLQSETHFGIIGMENGTFKTKGVISYGETLGEDGWRIQENDKILATRDFDGNGGRCEFLIQSSSHLGIVAYRNGRFETLTSSVMNRPINPNGWRLRATDELIGTGDFNNDNSIDFVLKNDTLIGIISYDKESHKFQTLGVTARIPISNNTKFFVGRLKNNDPEALVVSSPSGIQVFTLGSNSNIVEISTISPAQIGNTFGSQLTLATFLRLTDLDGNGEKELLIHYDDGTLSARKLNRNNLFSPLATAITSEELNDSLNGAQYRTKWTPSTNYEVLLNADLDGDGKEELFMRENNRVFVLDLNDSNKFRVHTEVLDNSRFDSLIQRTDAFIKSKTLQTRNLHSLFNDFAIANYLNSLDGVSDSKYQYARKDAIDVDHNPNTPPVIFKLQKNITADETLATIKQEAWSINYFKFTTASTAIGLASQMAHNIKANFSFIIVKDKQFIRKAHSTGENFLRTIVLEEGEEVIVIITSFDAPLEYNIHISI